MSCIFGHPDPQYRSEFWERLQSYTTKRNEQWMIMGDFNQIINNSQKKGGHPREESSFRDFNTMLDL